MDELPPPSDCFFRSGTKRIQTSKGLLDLGIEFVDALLPDKSGVVAVPLLVGIFTYWGQTPSLEVGVFDTIEGDPIFVALHVNTIIDPLVDFEDEINDLLDHGPLD